MNERQTAEEHLRVIRDLMERSTIYRAISAPTALVGGSMGLVAALLPEKFWAAIAGPRYAFHAAWGLVLLITLAANTVFIAREAARRGDPLVSPGMRLALKAVAPAMLTGGIFFGFFGGWILPPLLMVFYGLALLATSHFAPRSITFLGLAFLTSGCAILVWSLTQETLGYGINERIAMGATFGIFHLVYAACIALRQRQ